MRYTFRELCDMIDCFNSCMDNYLYVYDTQEDVYFISERAMERFALPSNCFHDVMEQHRKFVYSDDYEALAADLKEVVDGERTVHNMQYRWLDRSGVPVWINCRGHMISDETGKVRLFVGCINEIGKPQKADNISGLLGETSFRSRMKEIGKNVVAGFVMRIGIDDFSAINERFGPECGDGVLKTVAAGIASQLNSNQEVYRLGGDEFLIVDFVPSDRPCKQPDERAANELFHRIRSELDRCIQESGYKVVYTVSAGIVASQVTPQIEGYANLMKYSQFALREAKKQGKNRAYCFRLPDYEDFLHARELLRSLRQAVASDYKGFDLYFQSIMDAKDEKLYAAEALLRIRDKNGKFIPMKEAIPILEESGLIIPVGKWVLQKALDMCNECRKYNPDFRVSVNLSYVQILKSPLMAELKAMIGHIGINCSGIIVELTESGYLEGTPAVRNVWNDMKELHIQIALDDFGTGYSNLMNISNLEPDIVKLDREFTLKALAHPYEYQLMQYVIEMVHKLDQYVCVEGVETKEELDKIRKLGPDFIQGYYYGKPCSKEEFLNSFLEDKKNRQISCAGGL